MKIRVVEPKVAAAITGGCTFETEIGWWTYTNDDSLEILGKEFFGERDAVYIPTLQKTGEPVDEKSVRFFKKLATRLGFKNISAAAGMWILSETGEAQVEHIWILWTDEISVNTKRCMSKLAEKIKRATNQDCVAWEEAGNLNFTTCGTAGMEV